MRIEYEGIFSFCTKNPYQVELYFVTRMGFTLPGAYQYAR